MKIVNAKAEVILPYSSWEEARNTFYAMIEKAGRTCYKSETMINPKSSARFVKMIIENGHEAMLEHASMTVRFTVDRGVSHELVRHRLASFAQESTRYCNYSQDKFGNELTFIRPCFFKPKTPEYVWWLDSMKNAEETYMHLLELGATPQEARCVLPNSLKTEVVMTANMREWRHFFKLRAIGTTGAPHPQMKEVALPLLRNVSEKLPELFGDIERR